MNRINFNQTGGFPLDTNILSDMQSGYNIFNFLGNMAGEKTIISGCQVVGNSVSDGVVYLESEVLPFKGGTLGTSIIIKEDTESRIFEDGATKQVIFKRYATFGSSLPEKTFAWADFKRFENLIKNAETHADFEARITALENKKSPVPIGLIAIWGKPATEPLPEGWQECTDLRGRFPLGWNPDDWEFNELGKIGGEKKHTLTIDEMPRHSHKHTHSYTGRNNSLWHGDKGDVLASGWEDNKKETQGAIHSEGGNQPHNNMPPYRIIRFIEFVGF